MKSQNHLVFLVCLLFVTNSPILSLHFNKRRFLKDIKDTESNGTNKAIIDINEHAKKWQPIEENFGRSEIGHLKSNLAKKKEEIEINPFKKKLKKDNTTYLDLVKLIHRRSHSHIIVVKNQNEEISSSSSSIELNQTAYVQQVQEQWFHKKLEALNDTLPLLGEVPLSFADGPWGRHCGDPNQQDAPWGQCLPDRACDSEYRIYRGDYACGRVFVCCSIKSDMEDMNQAFDVSLIDSEIESDSEEKRDREVKSEEKRRWRDAREKKKRFKRRNLQKKKFKRAIAKIMKEVKHIFDKLTKNVTRERRRKMLALKKKIQIMKMQFRHERQVLSDLHQKQNVDAGLLDTLQEIKDLNENFVSNTTFRDLVVNGTTSKLMFRILLKAHPSLRKFLHQEPPAPKRRSMAGPDDKHNTSKEYDVEYGYLYY